MEPVENYSPYSIPSQTFKALEEENSNLAKNWGKPHSRKINSRKIKACGRNQLPCGKTHP